MPGKSHGQRSLVGYGPWGRKESDTTEKLHVHVHVHNICIFCNQKCHHLSEMPNWFLQSPVSVRLQCRRPWFNSWVRKIHWRRERLPSGSDGKVSVCNAGDPGSIPGLGRSPGEGNGNPLQYSCLEYPMKRGGWQSVVHEVAKESDTF